MQVRHHQNPLLCTILTVFHYFCSFCGPILLFYEQDHNMLYSVIFQIQYVVLCMLYAPNLRNWNQEWSRDPFCRCKLDGLFFQPSFLTVFQCGFGDEKVVFIPFSHNYKGCNDREIENTPVGDSVSNSGIL